MSDTSKLNPAFNLLRATADLLNGAFKKNEFQKIIPPFTVPRLFRLKDERYARREMDGESDF